MVSLPVPVVMVLAKTEPVTDSADAHGAGIEILEIRDVDGIARGLIDIGRDREIDRSGAAGGGEDQRIGTGAAVDRGFRATIGHRVVAGSGCDDVSAAAAVDRVSCRCRR